MEQDLKRIKKVYDTVAREYAEAFFDEHDRKPQDREVLAGFLTEIGDRRPVWDFGCGPGQTTKYLKDLGLDISGLDLSEKILEQAMSLYPEITFRQGNLLDLDFKDDSIAGIVAFYAIVHFTREQVETCFGEIFRVLQPGGLFLFTFHVGDETLAIDEFLGQAIDIDFMLLPVDFIYDCLQRIGFQNIEIIEREPYPEIEYQSRRAYVFVRKPG